MYSTRFNSAEEALKSLLGEDTDLSSFPFINELKGPVELTNDLDGEVNSSEYLTTELAPAPPVDTDTESAYFAPTGETVLFNRRRNRIQIFLREKTYVPELGEYVGGFSTFLFGAE